MFTLHSCSNFARTFKAIQVTFSWLVENSFSRINCGVKPAKCSKLRISDGSGTWQFSTGFAWATTQLIWVWHCFMLSPLLFFFSGQFWWKYPTGTWWTALDDGNRNQVNGTGKRNNKNVLTNRVKSINYPNSVNRQCSFAVPIFQEFQQI